jgi:hypothetical protein
MRYFYFKILDLVKLYFKNPFNQLVIKLLLRQVSTDEGRSCGVKKVLKICRILINIPIQSLALELHTKVRPGKTCSASLTPSDTQAGTMSASQNYLIRNNPPTSNDFSQARRFQPLGSKLEL